MRLALIGCMVMNREISHLISKSPHIVRTWWLRQGLHDTPAMLRTEVQQTIDAIERENEILPKGLRFDGILLAYGLCSNGVIGLRSRTMPLVIPRCDDCISLFLGSADRYRQLFSQLPGIYWYNTGWIEQAFTPSKANYERKRAEYAEEYGEENADYLMECNHSWMSNYRHCAFISCPLGDRPEYPAYVRQAADDFGWNFHEIEGDMTYFEQLVNGPWTDDQFLTCPPGHEVMPEFSNRKFTYAPYQAD